MSSAIILFLHSLLIAGTDPYPRNNSIDILHYTYRIALNDSTNIIAGRADIVIRFREPASEFQLNLVNKGPEGRGMEIFSITSSGKPVNYSHRSNIIAISSAGAKREDTVAYSISYGGEPIDGLIIGKNKFGDRTFFGDNWPDRGRNWLPAIDHPYDKAKVDFFVTAPEHYQVVATGKQIGEKSFPKKLKEHHWHEEVNVSVKVMTIGVARFSVQQSGEVDNIPITTWVFPQNAQAGFLDFAIAPQVFRFMQDYVGPYPYEKLAHVQSTTRFGGLENASNIFYFENAVNGKKQREGLIAHETAHQWFGDSVTEDDWHHVWLSEGFATYFASLYLGATYGKERLAWEMDRDRREVLEFSKKRKAPIIDTTLTDMNSVLNTNTYQKAAWFLHMLRARIGEEAFQRGIRTYYSKYRDLNASTSDFMNVMEAASGDRLGDFFDSWLRQPGHPRLRGQWHYDAKSNAVVLSIAIRAFKVPEKTFVDVDLIFPDRSRQKVRYPLEVGKDERLSIPVPAKPSLIILDPGTTLLFEGEIREKK